MIPIWIRWSGRSDLTLLANATPVITIELSTSRVDFSDQNRWTFPELRAHIILAPKSQDH
jgi:hypothetical protein